MGIHHWPGCHGNHDPKTGCQSPHLRDLSARLDQQITEQRAREYQEWEAELMEFATTCAPWVVSRGGWEALDTWEKVFLADHYRQTGRFWHQRLGMYATKPHLSRPDGWTESLPPDDHSGD